MIRIRPMKPPIGQAASLRPIWTMFALAWLALSGCSDSTGPSVTGSIEVATVTTGASLDPDGYVLTVDGGEEQAVGVNETVTLSAVEAGEHQFELAGLTTNCTVTSPNPLIVTVVTGGSVPASFEIECEFVDLEALGRIAFVRADLGAFTGDIWVMEAHGGNPVRLTDAVVDNCPAWSPNGMQIAFTHGDGFFGEVFDVYVMSADGSNPVNLTNNSASDGEPAWSPDGTKIAFVSDRDGNDEIYVMEADGSNPVRLTDDPAFDGNPAWSPDGTQIAFTHGDAFLDGFPGDVWVMDADGSNPVNLTNDPAFDGDPAWSPDGTRIAFTHGDASFDGLPGDVWVMDADGSNPVNLTNDPAEDLSPSWSRDGTKIAFVTGRDGSYEVYVMNADGSDPVSLANEPAAEDTNPSWSS
jgi:Tol biopolymer transport system component